MFFTRKALCFPIGEQVIYRTPLWCVMYVLADRSGLRFLLAINVRDGRTRAAKVQAVRAVRAAARMRSTSICPWEVLTKAASNWLGGSHTPDSSMLRW